MLTEKNGIQYWNGKEIPPIEDQALKNYVCRRIVNYKDIKWLEENREYIKECADIFNKYRVEDKKYNDIVREKTYLKELDKVYKYMETVDFYAGWISNEPIRSLIDKDVKIQNYSSYLTNYSVDEKFRDLDRTKEFINDYRSKYNEWRKQATGIVKGFNGEYDVAQILSRGLNAQYLKIINGVQFDKYEHDIIIVSEKGVYTLEVKNHSGKLEWKEGKFSESVKGIVKEGDITDPYVQCLNHKNSLNKVLSEEHIQSLILFANNELECSADDPKVIESIFYIDDFIKMFNSSKSVITEEKADELYNAIQSKRIYTKRKFKYVDMEKVNELYDNWMTELRYCCYGKMTPEIEVRKSEEQKVYKLMQRFDSADYRVRWSEFKHFKYVKRKITFDGEVLLWLCCAPVVYLFLSEYVTPIVNSTRDIGLVVLLWVIIMVGGPAFYFFTLIMFLIFPKKSIFTSPSLSKREVKKLNTIVDLANSIYEYNKNYFKEVKDKISTDFPELYELSKSIRS